VFYDPSAHEGSTALDEVLKGLAKLESIGVKISLLEKTSLSGDQMKKAVEEIRRIKPQSRGSVVASGGRSLPISGSKKLNLQNTPVLIVRDVDNGYDPTPIYVFPCKVGERYYSAVDGISFLSSNLPNIVELKGEMEETIISILRSNPEKLETGLIFDSFEVLLSTGKADLVFIDSKSRYLVIEVEREATDSAIGQVLRLAVGLERTRCTERVRCGIACFRIKENVLAAANRAGIEIWQAQDRGEFLKR